MSRAKDLIEEIVSGNLEERKASGLGIAVGNLHKIREVVGKLAKKHGFEGTPPVKQVDKLVYSAIDAITLADK